MLPPILSTTLLLAGLSLLSLVSGSAPSWVKCLNATTHATCVEYLNDTLAAHSTALHSRVLHDAILPMSDKCLHPSARSSRLELGWLEAAATAGTPVLPSRPVVVLLLPWTLLRLCGAMQWVVRILDADLDDRIEYTTVYDDAVSLYRLTSYDFKGGRVRVQELQAGNARGVILPWLSTLPAAVTTRRDLLLGYCSEHTELTQRLASRSPTSSLAGCPLAVDLDWSCAHQLAVGHAARTLGADFSFCDGHNLNDAVSTLARSWFFLCPRGAGPACAMMGPAIAAGAIPVYVWFSEKALPYADTVDWDTIAIVVHVSDLPDLGDRLRRVSLHQRRSMQAALRLFVQTHWTVAAVTRHISMWLTAPSLSALGPEGPYIRRYPPVELPMVKVAEGMPTMAAAIQVCQHLFLSGVDTNAAVTVNGSAGWECIHHVGDDIATARDVVLADWRGGAVAGAPVTWSTDTSPDNDELNALVGQALLFTRLAERSRRDAVHHLRHMFGSDTVWRTPTTKRSVWDVDVDGPDFMTLSSDEEAALVATTTDRLQRLLGIETASPFLPPHQLLMAAAYHLNLGAPDVEDDIVATDQQEECRPRDLSGTPADCIAPPGYTMVLLWGTVGMRHAQDSMFGLTIGADVENCAASPVGGTPPSSNKPGCVWTDAKECVEAADAVVVVDWTPVDLPPRLCGQRRVLVQLEAPTQPTASLPRSHLESFFDVLSTYRLDSDVPWPYFPYDGTGEAMGLFDPIPVPFAARRQDALAAMLISNCALSSNGRLVVAKQLMNSISVHSYGSCLHNHDFPAAEDDDTYSRAHYQTSNVEPVLSDYLFLIVFENANCVDYVSEKLWRAYRAGVVPVYLGAPNVRTDFAPLPDAVISVNDFRSIDDLGAYLTYLASNSTAYMHHLAYKQRVVTPRFKDLWLTPGRGSWQCRVCDFVAQNRSRGFWRDDSCGASAGLY